VYGVVLSLAPLVYSAKQKVEGGQMFGSRVGYVLAAAITAVAGAAYARHGATRFPDSWGPRCTARRAADGYH
jgi:hypothetical protein